MQCPQCGIPNRDEAKFCTKCGFVLSSAKSLNEPAVAPKQSDEDPTFPPERPQQAAVITLTDPIPSPTPTPYLEAVFTVGLRAGERVTIVDFPATIGRDPNSTLAMALNDTLASTRHAQVNFNGRNFSLRDVGSTNGTYYQGRRIKEMMLSHGDVIEFGIGGPQIRFEFPSAVQTPRMVKAEVVAPAPGLEPEHVSSGQFAKPDKVPAWAKNPPPPPILAVATPDPLTSPPAIKPAMYDQPNGAPIPPTINQPPGLAPGRPAPPPSYQQPGPPPAMHLPQASMAPPSALAMGSPSPTQSKAVALVKIAAGFFCLAAGIGVSVVFRNVQILVGFMICVMLIGLGLMIWGSMQFLLGGSNKK